MLPEVELNLIPVYEVEVAPPPVCLAPLVVDASLIASIFSFSAKTRSFRASSSSFESPLTYNKQSIIYINKHTTRRNSIEAVAINGR